MTTNEYGKAMYDIAIQYAIDITEWAIKYNKSKEELLEILKKRQRDELQNT